MTAEPPPDSVFIEIGGRGHLSEDTLREMARAPGLVHETYPQAVIQLTLGGYDDDPRSIWDIPEAAQYVRWFAALSGLADWHGGLFKALDSASKAVLIRCRAIREPHPFRVDIVPDP